MGDGNAAGMGFATGFCQLSATFIGARCACKTRPQPPISFRSFSLTAGPVPSLIAGSIVFKIGSCSDTGGTRPVLLKDRGWVKTARAVAISLD